MKSWTILTREGLPCPIEFDPEDVRETMKLDGGQREADDSLEAYQNIVGCSPEGWVPPERYKESKALSKKLKETALAAAESEEERAEILAH